MSDNVLHIGNHLSASKGYLAMGEEAVSLGANVFAFFTRNPRGGKAKPIDEKDSEGRPAQIRARDDGR